MHFGEEFIRGRVFMALLGVDLDLGVADSPVGT